MDHDALRAQEEELSGGRTGWGVGRRRGAAAALAVLLGWGFAAAAQSPVRGADLVDLPDAPANLPDGPANLPDAPGAVLMQRLASSSSREMAAEDGDAGGQNQQNTQRSPTLPLCPYGGYPAMGASGAAKSTATPPAATGPPPVQNTPCRQENPLQPIVTSSTEPLTAKEKGMLAVRNFINPFNLLTIVAYSGVAVAANSHSAYGPGFAGWGRYTGYGLAQDAQGEFLETYAIPVLAHEDPRYHRMPHASVKRRVWHAIEHTYVSQHDDGRPMPNYATLITYPLSAAVSNLYVPGIRTDVPATAKRVAIGIATDPAGALTAEFLPDVAKRIHIHIVFVQEILNRMATGGIGGVPSTAVVDGGGVAQ